MSKIDEIRQLIESKWIITDETSNRIYFKTKDQRGVPKYYFNKTTLQVVRTDKSDVSSKEAITVEVRTNIYSLLDPEVKPVTAQEVFENRNTEYVEGLINKYGGV